MDLKKFDKVFYGSGVGEITMFDYGYRYAKIRGIFKRNFCTWEPIDKLIPVIPMPLDEKHISSDWIQDSFFDVCVEKPNKYVKHHKFLGYRNGRAFSCAMSCNSNFVTIDFLNMLEMQQSIKDLQEFFDDMNDCLQQQDIYCSVEFREFDTHFFKCMVSFYAKAI